MNAMKAASADGRTADARCEPSSAYRTPNGDEQAEQHRLQRDAPASMFDRHRNRSQSGAQPKFAAHRPLELLATQFHRSDPSTAAARDRQLEVLIEECSLRQGAQPRWWLPR